MTGNEAAGSWPFGVAKRKKNPLRPEGRADCLYYERRRSAVVLVALAAGRHMLLVGAATVAAASVASGRLRIAGAAR